MQTALYGKIEKRKVRREVNGYLECKHKTYLTFKALMRVKAHRRVLMMGKARRRKSAQSEEFSRLVQ